MTPFKGYTSELSIFAWCCLAGRPTEAERSILLYFRTVWSHPKCLLGKVSGLCQGKSFWEGASCQSLERQLGQAQNGQWTSTARECSRELIHFGERTKCFPSCLKITQDNLTEQGKFLWLGYTWSVQMLQSISWYVLCPGSSSPKVAAVWAKPSQSLLEWRCLPAQIA